MKSPGPWKVNNRRQSEEGSQSFRKKQYIDNRTECFGFSLLYHLTLIGAQSEPCKGGVQQLGVSEHLKKPTFSRVTWKSFSCQPAGVDTLLCYFPFLSCGSALKPVSLKKLWCCRKGSSNIGIGTLNPKKQNILSVWRSQGEALWSKEWGIPIIFPFLFSHHFPPGLASTVGKSATAEIN